jgi:hypothetical protein
MGERESFLMKNSKMMGRIAGGIAAGAIALLPLAANAQPSAPTQVTGTVVRYYVDRSGYVTAADIQTANGVSLVRFSPNMGQRLYSTYPVGGQASVYVVGTPESRWDVVGVGAVAPTSMWGAATATDIDLLEAEPKINSTNLVTRKGKLKNLILNKSGDIIGIVLDNNILIRTPRETRHIAAGNYGTERVAGLFKGARVEVTGYEEAPRYGSLSNFTNRIAANTLTINGRNVGAIGLPRLSPVETKSLFKWNIGGADMTQEEINASNAGYSTYTPAM